MMISSAIFVWWAVEFQVFPLTLVVVLTTLRHTGTECDYYWVHVEFCTCSPHTEHPTAFKNQTCSQLFRVRAPVQVYVVLREIFSRMGIPNRVHSDRGSQFTSEMMKEVYRLLSIRQSTTSPYHAIGNGIVENFSRTIKNLLKKIVAQKPRDWHRYLGPLMFAVRDTPQDSTGWIGF